MSTYPVFTISKIKEEGGILYAIGLLDRTEQGKEKWINDGWVGSLKSGSKVAFGRWSKENELWKFKFDEEEKKKIEIIPGELVFAIDGYWGERVEITLDESIEWKKSEFYSEGQWDHEHCAICWASISEYENTNYYLGNERHPICTECYHNYVKIRNISFVPIA